MLKEPLQNHPKEMPFIEQLASLFHHPQPLLKVSDLKLDFKDYQKIGCLLPRSPFITDLTIQNCSMDDRGAFELAKGIAHQPRLKQLHLENCNLSTQSLIWLIKAIQKNGHLETLHLQKNVLTTQGVLEMAKRLHRLESLRQIALVDCHIGPKSAQYLGYWMANLSQLEHIDLSHNRLGDLGVRWLCLSLIAYRKALKTMSLQATKVQSMGLEAIAAYLLDNESLSKLDLQYNALPERGIEALFFSLSTNQSLTHLYLQNTTLSEEGAQLLFKLFQQNTHLNTIGLPILHEDMAEAFLKVLTQTPHILKVHTHHPRWDIYLNDALKNNKLFLTRVRETEKIFQTLKATYFNVSRHHFFKYPHQTAIHLQKELTEPLIDCLHQFEQSVYLERLTTEWLHWILKRFKIISPHLAFYLVRPLLKTAFSLLSAERWSHLLRQLGHLFDSAYQERPCSKKEGLMADYFFRKSRLFETASHTLSTTPTFLEFSLGERLNMQRKMDALIF